jgi:hypothetical protein
MKKNYNMVNLMLMSIVTAAITITFTACSDDLDLNEATNSLVNNNGSSSI